MSTEEKIVYPDVPEQVEHDDHDEHVNDIEEDDINEFADLYNLIEEELKKTGKNHDEESVCLAISEILRIMGENGQIGESDEE